MRMLLPILLLKALVLALLINYSDLGLSPDEAQYWTWSQDLDWGYYSKPPGIAWQMALTSSIFGNTSFGVRFGALCIGLCLSLAVYGVARAAALNKKIAFWSALIAAFCPLGIYLSFAATTDGGAILFLTCAVGIAAKGVRKEQGPNYLLIGLCIALGALFKWTAFIFWPYLLCSLFFFKNLRKWSALTAFCISLVALIPPLFWNATHDWATFRHVGKTVGVTKGGNFLDFFAAQIGLLFPVFFILLVMSYFFLKKRNSGLLFIAGFPLIALVYLIAAFFKKMQPNWAAHLYPAGLPLVAWIACEKIKKGKIWLHVGTWLSILSVAFMFLVPWLQEKGKWEVPYKLNPFRQLVGWNKLSLSLSDAGYRPETHFLFADKYQAASLLSFYGPSQRRAYFFNISQARKNQFSFWPQMTQKERGRTGYFVVLENTSPSDLNWYQNHYTTRLLPYFEKIQFRGAYPLFFVGHQPVKYAIIFECINYEGETPPDTSDW